MNYDMMSAHELIILISDDEADAVLESTLRRKVIEEASVGKASIKQRAIDGFPLIDGLTITRCEDLSAWTAYDLIPREVIT